jgi:hypothetical protein
MITAIMAVVSDESQARVNEWPKIIEIMALSGPFDWKNSQKTYPATAGTIIIGTSIRV